MILVAPSMNPFISLKSDSTVSNVKITRVFFLGGLGCRASLAGTSVHTLFCQMKHKQRGRTHIHTHSTTASRLQIFHCSGRRSAQPSTPAHTEVPPVVPFMPTGMENLFDHDPEGCQYPTNCGSNIPAHPAPDNVPPETTPVGGHQFI